MERDKEVSQIHAFAFITPGSFDHRKEMGGVFIKVNRTNQDVFLSLTGARAGPKFGVESTSKIQIQNILNTIVNLFKATIPACLGTFRITSTGNLQQQIILLFKA